MSRFGSRPLPFSLNSFLARPRSKASVSTRMTTSPSPQLEGRATFVATGDPDLLEVREHGGIRIVSPSSLTFSLDAAGV
jgi:hypothetical protein